MFYQIKISVCCTRHILVLPFSDYLLETLEPSINSLHLQAQLVLLVGAVGEEGGLEHASG